MKSSSACGHRGARLFPIRFAVPKVLASALVLPFLLMWAEGVCAGGLRTLFVEVTLDRVKIGQSYTLRPPLAITNTGARSTQFKFEAVTPEPIELRDGYETIPDPSWIRFEREIFTVEPDGTAQTDVILDVPDDVAYLGKSYQVVIDSQSMGGTIGIGFRSKVLFTIDSVR